jgi:molybdate transport repressor ModE-like protein
MERFPQLTGSAEGGGTIVVEERRPTADRAGLASPIVRPRVELSADPKPLRAQAPAPRSTIVKLDRAIRDVQMENIHPLRLRLLLEIERTGSISAAADQCAIAQPSASMHLRTLESAIGQRLVARNGRGSSLTPAGKVVASHAAEALAALDSMRRELDALSGRGAAELKLAASLTPSVVLLPRILGQLSDRYPGLTIRLMTMPSETVVREVARGAAGIGIAGEVFTSEPIISRQIMEDELVGIARAGTLRFEDGCVGLAELARHSLLVGGETSSTRIAAERYLARAGYRPTRVCVFDSYAAITAAVADGVGVSFVSRFLIRERVERGELIAFRIKGMRRMTRPIHIVQPAATDPSPEDAAFVALLNKAPWFKGDRWQAAAAD